MGATIIDLLSTGADDAIALAAPERHPTTFARLREHVTTTVASLNWLGIARNDRVAIVLQNGPEMASAFLSIASGATTAPLNPAYRQEEFAFYLTDLKAKALVLAASDDSPARAAANELGIRVLDISITAEDPAGVFRFTNASDSDRAMFAESDDVALVLHTSGTTSRPKIVPLTHANLSASADNIKNLLQLEPLDRCLNVMPLFHIHGLVAAILASLNAGGSTYCTPGFNALRFFAWMDDAAPSWYTAVPTMHQTIVARAKAQSKTIKRNPLRFIRSSSASLPPKVMAELESAFDAPVIEAYAMTEAAHQMTSNPLPPASRHPGSVGIAAGPEVAVMDEAGHLVDNDTIGEVVIRGPNVTAGYENNSEANASAFNNGWFRTGDQGTMDDAGYLRITGRLKEIINRGGEKISPREIDEVILDHPAVAQAVCFAMPHDKLGEDIAAAIVLADGANSDEHELRNFITERVADFKVPRKIVFLDEIPKGPTGKVQRIGLAEKLGLRK